MTLDELHEEHLAASEVERALWARVKDGNPGQPGHDPEAWHAWLEAAHRVQALARRIREHQAG